MSTFAWDMLLAGKAFFRGRLDVATGYVNVAPSDGTGDFSGVHR